MSKKIIVCAEFGAFALKNAVLEHLISIGCDVTDISLREDGTDRPYYEVGAEVGKAISAGDYDQGFVFCGSGMGVCMAANRFEGVYCACCETLHSSIMARGINNANVLALGFMITGSVLGCLMAAAFVNSEFLNDAPKHIKHADLQMGYDELMKIDHLAHNLG